MKIVDTPVWIRESDNTRWVSKVLTFRLFFINFRIEWSKPA